MTPYTREELWRMITQIDDADVDLTDWEVGFIGDLIDTKPVRFTPKQIEQIVRIHAKL